jgi:hypothetical protein
MVEPIDGNDDQALVRLSGGDGREQKKCRESQNRILPPSWI